MITSAVCIGLLSHFTKHRLDDERSGVDVALLEGIVFIYN